MRSLMTSQGGAAALALVALFSAGTVASAEGWGNVKGTVKYDKKAKLPDNPVIAPTNDKAYCEKHEKGGKLHRNEWVVDEKTRGIKNVIVWLTPADPKKAETAEWDETKIHPKLKEAPKTHEADQPACTFTPRIIALREETELIFKNSAEVSHNVSIEGGDLGPKVNVAIPSKKQFSVGKVKARHLPIEYKCTIHPWMKGWIASFKHPYFAVTNEKGEFEIKDAPEGEWRLQVWHEGYGFVQKFDKNKQRERGIVIKIKDGETTTVDVPELARDED